MNYADDFVILCRRNPAEAGEPMEAIMAKKIRVCRVPEESFEFLRYALWGMSFEPDGTQLYWHLSGKETCEVALRENRPAGASDYRVRKPESWWELSTRNCEANYFSLGPVSKAYRAVDSHMRYRLRRWLCNEHKVQRAGRQNVFRAAWTPATGSSDFQPAVGEGIKDPSPKACTCGLMSGEWKRSGVCRYRATPRLYSFLRF